jgi:lipid A 3-O-deacylase
MSYDPPAGSHSKERRPRLTMSLKLKLAMLLEWKLYIFVLAAVVMVMISSPLVLAEETESGWRSKFSLTESTLIIGFGKGGFTEGSYEHIALIWQLGFDLRRVFSRLEDNRGILTFIMEPKINRVISPNEQDVELGISFGLKYRYPFTQKLSGYVLGSVGPHYITVKSTDQANGFIFFNTVGAGFSFFLTEKTALSLEYRFRHISNADTLDPNVGIESHIGAIGYSMFF